MSRKRKILTLKERVAVLKEADKGKSCYAIATESWSWEDTNPDYSEGKRRNHEVGEYTCSKPRRAGYKDLDKSVWEWFTIARAKTIPLSGRLIQKKALMYA